MSYNTKDYRDLTSLTFLLSRYDGPFHSPALHYKAWPSDSPPYQAPRSDQLLGEWFIVLTSLPYWRDKRNIKVTYSASEPTAADAPTIYDTVTFQTLTSDKLKSVQGVNTSSQLGQLGGWDWRGTGWVKVVSNHWDVLGHNAISPEDGQKIEWFVIHTKKSFFTPAAIHIYSRRKQAPAEGVRESLLDAFTEHQELKCLLGCMFKIQHN